MKEITDLLPSKFWWIAVILLVVHYLIKELVINTGIIKYLMDRKINNINDVNTYLNNTTLLSPTMLDHLKRKKERLIFEKSEGLSVSYPMIEQIISISEDNPGGLPWRIIRLAKKYITLDNSGQLRIIFDKEDWFEIIYSSIIAALLFSGMIFFIYLLDLPGLPIKLRILLLLSALFSLVGAVLNTKPLINKRAGKQVEKYLNSRKAIYEHCPKYNNDYY